MVNPKNIGIAISIMVLVAIACTVSLQVKRQHDNRWLPVLPGAEKTRLVYLKMTPEDWKRDEEYGSVYPSVEQAQIALVKNPHDPKAHRTLARNFVNKIYTNPEYNSVEPESPRFQEVRHHVLTPLAAEDQAALVADPNNPVTKRNLAVGYSQMGENAKAISLFKQVRVYPPLQEEAEHDLLLLQATK